jgi:hypothetical protein
VPIGRPEFPLAPCVHGSIRLKTGNKFPSFQLTDYQISPFPSIRPSGSSTDPAVQRSACARRLEGRQLAENAINGSSKVWLKEMPTIPTLRAAVKGPTCADILDGRTAP